MVFTSCQAPKLLRFKKAGLWVWPQVFSALNLCGESADRGVELVRSVRHEQKQHFQGSSQSCKEGQESLL